MRMISDLMESLNLMPIAIGSSSIVLALAALLIASQRKRVQAIKKIKFIENQIYVPLWKGEKVEQEVTVSSFNVEEMTAYMQENISETVFQIDEIAKTNPNINISLGRDKNDKLILVASVQFSAKETLTPMEYMERLVVAEMIKLVVSNKFKSSRSDTPEPENVQQQILQYLA